MNRNFIYVLLFVLVLSCSKKEEAEVKMITPEEMTELLELEEVQLIDVRTRQEHETGFIAHSQNIDFRSPTFDDDIAALDKSKPVILYCKSGGRSAECSKKLKKAGFKLVYELEGGITQWQFENHEIKTYN
ncbi:MAG: rhodanese-like domain-containing protein [Bacteroidota bacterium]